ncbi:hypothetical protein WMF45_36330 [Sorangium sp. So ce448]|uniref:hypothetical protein n=1 Tax=Sorangium sp. So ce448 TaxID=3133314 RepID=UPI003F63AC01
MREETRRAALRAAARVALGALACGALAGCSGRYVSGGQSSPLDPDEEIPAGEPDGPASAGVGATTGVGGTTGVGATTGGGGEPSTGSGVIPTPDEGGAGGAGGSGGAPPTPTGLACAEQVSLDDTEARPRAELDCCVDYGVQRLPAPGTGISEEQRAALAGDASFVNCCTALIVGVDANAISYRDAEPVRHACCFGDVVAPEGELYTRTFCTPWGPPVPPALDAYDAPSEVA